MKDWVERALKTFVQAFLGVFMPAVLSILNGGLPIDWSLTKATLLSALMAALAAGISAVWNIMLEKNKEKRDHE